MQGIFSKYLLAKLLYKHCCKSLSQDDCRKKSLKSHHVFISNLIDTLKKMLFLAVCYHCCRGKCKGIYKQQSLSNSWSREVDKKIFQEKMPVNWYGSSANFSKSSLQKLTFFREFFVFLCVCVSTLRTHLLN